MYHKDPRWEKMLDAYVTLTKEFGFGCVRLDNVKVTKDNALYMYHFATLIIATSQGPRTPAIMEAHRVRALAKEFLEDQPV